jgi:hypothetical protein
MDILMGIRTQLVVFALFFRFRFVFGAELKEYGGHKI